MLKKLLSIFLIFAFLLSLIISPGYAQTLFHLPKPGSMVEVSEVYAPLLVKGLRVHADNPLLFDFVIDLGDTQLTAEDSKVRDESERLIKYFLACLTIPEEDLWVNLSPYEKDRMIPQTLGQTELGRDMLAQDYLLKQLTASMIYPEKQLGRDFWDRVYKKAQEQYGTTEIPVSTFNKVWVLADTAKIYEHKDTAYLISSHLQVMLDEDYLAKQKSEKNSNTTNTIGNQIIREIILPEIEKEVNEGKNFAPLRQIFHSFILATWYKKNLKQALLNQVYSNKAKTAGLSFPNSSVGNPERIYQQYLQAYKKGVFNYIKDSDPVNIGSGATSFPRKYFSGGTVLAAKGVVSTAMASKAELLKVRQLRERGILAAVQMARQSSGIFDQDVPSLSGKQSPSQLTSFSFKGKVLIVEDHVSLAEGMRMALEADGYEVTVVDDGRDGLREMRTGQFNIVFTDNNLGDGKMWGGAMALEKSRDPNIRGIPIVSVSDDESAPYAGRLPKPFIMSEVVNLTKKLALPATGWMRFRAGMAEIKAHLKEAAERQWALVGNEGRLHYYDTFVGNGEPTRGYAVGVDASGTNLVVGIIYIDERGKKTLIKESLVSEKWSNVEKDDPRLMFPKMAELVVRAISKIPESIRADVKFWPVGFSFGFPMIQTGRMSATVPTEKEKEVIKGFHLKQLTHKNPENNGVDLDIVQLFNNALAQKLAAEGLTDQIGVTIVLNDTTAVLMRIKNAIAGFVNGTGFNGAIRFLTKIVNGELGAFDIPAAFKTAIDLVLAKEPGNPAEKLITGPAILENIFMQMDVSLPKRDEALAQEKESHLRQWMGQRVLEKDKDDPNKMAAYKKWQGEFFLLRDAVIRASQSEDGKYLSAFKASKGAASIFTAMTEEELQILVPIFVDIYKRSAYMYGMLLAIHLTMADPNKEWFHKYGYSIPHDGSTTEQVPFYKDWLKEALALFGYEKVNFKVGDAEADGDYPGEIVFFSFNDPQAKANLTTLLGAGGAARIGLTDKASIVKLSPGGIDLKRSDLKLDVEKRDGGMQMKPDQAMVARFQAGDFSGVKPIILQIVPAQGQLNSLDI